MALTGTPNQNSRMELASYYRVSDYQLNFPR
jgi:hypothetical protein